MRAGLRGALVSCAVGLGIALGAPLRAEPESEPETEATQPGGSDRTGLDLRLQGTVGIFLDLGDRIEDTPAYEASDFAGQDLEPQPAMGVNAEVGWRLHPRVAASVHMEHLVDYSVNVDNGARAGPRAGNGVLTGKSWALTGDLRVYALTDTIQPYLIAGAGWMWVDTTDAPVVQTSQGDDPMLEPLGTNMGSRDGFVTRAGGGVDIFLSDAFFVTTQATYVLPVGPVREFDYVSIAWGFGYLF